MKKFKNILIGLVFVTVLFGCSAESESISTGEEIIVNAAEPAAQAAFPRSFTQQTTPLSSCTTKFGPGDGRLNNIKLSSVAIDGMILDPGDEFSFNEVVGKTTKDKGYKKATVFFKGKEAKEYGGGICQVSSTLYNAALDAGLEITERHPHSLKVHYVPEGRDAATSYGGKDLKFVNNFEYPVKINTYVGEGTITAEIIMA